MSILSDFEDRVSRAVEGVFAGVFRSPVQPAELARACAKEMDRRKKLGVGKVYAPTVYSVLLSPDDGDQLGGFSDTLAGELETYLIGYARERGYLLAARPRVRFLVDEGLKLGRFDVIGELLSPEEIATEFAEAPVGDSAPPAAVAAPAAAPAGVPAAAGDAGSIAPAASRAVFDIDADDVAVRALQREPGIATITVPGIEHDVVLSGDRMIVGRLKACDICLPDKNASRQHAALEREGSGWTIADLGSTNGTLLNGEPVERERLKDGDHVTIGITDLIFHEPRS